MALFQNRGSNDKVSPIFSTDSLISDTINMRPNEFRWHAYALLSGYKHKHFVSG
jgi:hypothetical protein